MANRCSVPMAPMIKAAVLACACCAASGCVREVLSGEDPDVKRPTATGDSKRDQLVFNIPWMEAPIPRILWEGQPVVAERVSALTPDNQTSYMLRTRTGASATILITTKYPAQDVVEFTYDVQKLAQGYTLDLPVGLGRIGRRGAIKIDVNGAPFNAPPTADIAIVSLARDEKTRIRATRIPDPAPVTPTGNQVPVAPPK